MDRDMQTDRWTDRRTGRETDGLTERLTVLDRRTYRMMISQKVRQTVELRERMADR